MKTKFTHLNTTQDVRVRAVVVIKAIAKKTAFTSDQVWQTILAGNSFGIKQASAKLAVQKAIRRLAAKGSIKTEHPLNGVKRYSRPTWGPSQFNTAVKSATGFRE